MNRQALKPLFKGGFPKKRFDALRVIFRTASTEEGRALLQSIVGGPDIIGRAVKAYDNK